MTGKYTTDNVCAYCVMELMTNAASRHHIRYSNPEMTDYDLDNADLRSYEVEKIARAMVAIFNRGDHLEINAYWARPAILTLHGTKLCEVHMANEWNQMWRRK